MSTRTLTVLLVATCFGAPAFAADMPVKTRPAPVEVIYNWTGFYVGGHLGAGWARKEWEEQGRREGDPLGSHNALGVLGGFQAGFNYQISPRVVLGIEGQFSFADLKGDHQNNTSASGALTQIGENERLTSTFANIESHERFSTKVRDIATIAGRIGFVGGPQDRMLWYVKGGGAWARDNFADSIRENGVACSNGFSGSLCTSSNTSIDVSARQSRWGWMVGTGLEYALFGNWSAKIEYDYLDLGNKDVTLRGTGTTITSGVGDPVIRHFDTTRNVKVDQTLHIVKIGVNYRFFGGY